MDCYFTVSSGQVDALCTPEHTVSVVHDWWKPTSFFLPQIDEGSTSPESFNGASQSSVSVEDSCIDLGHNFYSEIPEDVVDLVCEYSDPNSIPNPLSAPQTHILESVHLDYLYVPQSTLQPERVTKNGQARRSEEQLLHRRMTNREASFRYRQKLKQKTGQLQEELMATFAAYQRAEEAYKKTEQSFDVTAKLIRSLL